LRERQNFSNLKKFGFNQEANFQNIINFHIKLFMDIINNNNINHENVFFYITNLININETKYIIKQLLDQVIFQKKYHLYYHQNYEIYFFNTDFLKFDYCYDINILYTTN
jgi:hypothetical protein